MNRNKCLQCGLVNSASDETCRRCGSLLTESALEDAATEEPVKKRSIGKRIIWIAGATVFALLSFYLSLRITSEDLDFDKRQVVHRSINILEQKGFATEASMLRNLTTYRSTDSWWNRYVGHHSAFAATNFPFEIMTLYPEFFDQSSDDVERAIILLHESYHLRGHGEAAALEATWQNKQRLGWTEEKYGESRVWKNTKALTMDFVPELFRCGPEGQSDCVP